MNSYWTLTKTFMAAVSMSKPQDLKRKIIMTVFIVLVLFGVLIPVTVVVGFLVKVMTDIIMQVGIPYAGLSCMLHIITIFTFVFGLSVISNEFYFSNDIEFLLPWPLKAGQIVAAKFTACVIGENMMQAILVLSCLIGFACAAGMDLLQIVIALIGVATLPIVPMAYCGMISILIMGLTKRIKNKDGIQKFSVAAFFAMILLLVGSMGSLQNLDLEEFVLELASGKQVFFHLCDYIFPNVSLFVGALVGRNFVKLLLYFGINAVVVLLMLGLAELLYFSGVIGISSATPGKRAPSLERVLSKCTMHSAKYSYFMKEVRILLRTPVFFTNCIAVNFIWPVFVYAMYKLQKTTLSVAMLRKLYAANDFRIRLLFLVGILAIAIVISAMNSISSGAISREGKHFSFMKYIPMDYVTQWDIKAMVGIIFPFTGIVLFFVPACIVLQLPLLHMLLYVTNIFLAISFVSYMGVYIDAIQPKLIWDDEMNALRENYNTFFGMGIAILFGGILCLMGILLYKFSGKSLLVTGLAMLAVLLIANGFVQIYTVKNGAKYIAEQEEC